MGGWCIGPGAIDSLNMSGAESRVFVCAGVCVEGWSTWVSRPYRVVLILKAMSESLTLRRSQFGTEKCLLYIFLS